MDLSTTLIYSSFCLTSVQDVNLKSWELCITIPGADKMYAPGFYNDTNPLAIHSTLRRQKETSTLPADSGHKCDICWKRDLPIPIRQQH